MKADDAQRLRGLERENAQLRLSSSIRALQAQALRELAKGTSKRHRPEAVDGDAMLRAAVREISG